MPEQKIEPKDGKAIELEDGKAIEQVKLDQDGNPIESKKDGEETEQDQKLKEEQKSKTVMGEVNSYQAKIDAGTITKEEAPAWMQNDLKAKAEEDSPESMEAKITKKVRDDLEFEQLQKTLPKDLTQEQADKMNEVLESEIAAGRSQVEAFKYAAYEAGVDMRKEDPKEAFIRATKFPVITPRKLEKKPESLIKTQDDQDYVDMIKESQGIEVKG